MFAVRDFVTLQLVILIIAFHVNGFDLKMLFKTYEPKAIKKKSMSQTHLVKKLSAMRFKKKKINSGNELSPMRFFLFFYFFYSQGSNVYVLCDIQKQKH